MRRPSTIATVVAVLGMLALEIFLIWSMFFRTQSGFVTVQVRANHCSSTSAGRTSSKTDCTATFDYQGKTYSTTTSELHEGGTESLSVKVSALQNGPKGYISGSDVEEHHLDVGRLIWIIAIGVLLILLVAARIALFLRARRRGVSVKDLESNADRVRRGSGGEDGQPPAG